MSQNHFTLSFPLKSPTAAKLLAEQLPPLMSELFRANDAIGTVSEHLPLFDLWPFRYATSYDLKPECQPLRASDPNFFACYRPVGDFPEVDLSPKLIITRMITAFGAGTTGLL